jgi:hypothetical protein
MYRYWKDLDREGNTFLSPRAKTQHMMLFGAKNPAFTLKLQQSAAASVGGVQAAMPGGPAAPKTGMTHAAATSKAMAPMVSLLTTQSQESEAKPAGRRQKGAETPTPF